MMSDKELYNKVKHLIDTDIKMLVSADGGKITLVYVEDGRVGVRLGGACSHCSAVNYTMKNVVERIIFDNFPEIETVELV
ncbi:MAG: NifU family protein [Candidatus Kapabacteria bacterium]|nr:NifU family protein [Candidatus Kapabacteria bacterium]